MNILIAVRSTTVRRAIADLLRANLEISLINEVASGVDAGRQLSLVDWDLVILGIHLPEYGGLHFLRLFKAAKTHLAVIMVGSYAHAPVVRLCLDAGAWGYVVTDFLADELLPSVQAALSGKVYLGHAMVEELEAYDRSGTNPKPPLH